MLRTFCKGWLALLPVALLIDPQSLPAAADKGFNEVTQVTAVEIPVQVVRDGEPVRGLTANDFTVSEGRKQMPIVGFDVVDLTAGQTSANGVPPAPVAVSAAGRRHFLMLFDLANSEPASLVRARAAATDIVVRSLTSSDLVAVATYSQSQGPRLVLNFTTDRRQVVKAIDHLGLPNLVDRNPDPLRVIAEDFAANMASGAPQGKRDAIVLEEMQNLQRASAQVTRENLAQTISALARSFSDLARLMASVSGRKEVIYLSEGFDSSILQGNLEDDAQHNMADDAMHGDIQKIDSNERFGNTHQNDQLEKMMEAFRRGDCVVQAVDIGGLRANSGTSGRSGQALGATRANGDAALFQMAHDTGGELYQNFNDLGAAMGQLLKKTSVTYVLTVQPQDLKSDGTYHALKVELKNSSRGTKVTARPGYFAPRPFSQMGGLERVLTAANALMGDASGTVAVNVLAPPFRSAMPKAYVPVLIEVEGNAFLAGTNADKGPVVAEIYAYAMDSAGQVQDYFVQSIGLDAAKAGPALRQSGFKYFGHLELPAGEYGLHVMVRNGQSGVFGDRLSQLVVPDYLAEKPVVLQPLFPETPGKWVMVRERPRGDLKDAAYPFMVGNQAYIPASLPVLSADHDAALELVGWNWGGDVKASARVLAADGHDLGAVTGSLKVSGRDPGLGMVPEALRLSFRPPASLSPGEYKLVVQLTTEKGTETAATRFAIAPGGVAPRG